MAARYIPLEEWPGGVLYTSGQGRTYCAAPRGLVPEHPYLMHALRQPSDDETEAWGSGALPRMVVDVTEVIDLARHLRQGTLYIAPWNAYFVLRLSEGPVLVAYRARTGIRRLDLQAAHAVALAAGIDVAGWPVDLTRGEIMERWMFTPPSYDVAATPSPELELMTV
jgi:hypothetical protein